MEIVLHFIKGDIALILQIIPLLTTNKLIKTAGKLIEDNNLNPLDFPDVIFRMKKVAVRYFVNSDDIEISQLVELLSDDIDCMTILVEELEFKCNTHTVSVKRVSYLGVIAAKILREYPHVGDKVNPKALAVIREIPPGEAMLNSEDKFGPNDQDAIRYPFDVNTVCFVGDEESVARMDLESTDVLGLDCEWRPSLTKFQQYPVSLLQISTRSTVYIIDLIRLNTSAQLNAKLSAAFQSPNILKLGLSFADDRKLLIKSYRGVTAFEGVIANYGELQGIYQEIFPEEKGTGGLAMLCQRFLKKKLCKAEQKSNWERRPLRLAQLHYAALDAYIEILIWDALTLEAADLDEDPMDSVCNLGSPDEEQRHSFSGGRSFKCKNCGEIGHKQKQCQKGSKCFLCKQFGHLAANCPKVA